MKPHYELIEPEPDIVRLAKVIIDKFSTQFGDSLWKLYAFLFSKLVNNELGELTQQFPDILKVLCKNVRPRGSLVGKQRSDLVEVDAEPDFGKYQKLLVEVLKYIYGNCAPKDRPYAFADALESTGLSELTLWGSSKGVREALEMTFMIVYQVRSLQLAGKRVYTVTPGLAEKLRNTEIRGLTTADLRLPYESLYIEIPLEAGLQVWNVGDGIHQAYGVYVTEDKHSRDDKGDKYRGWRLMFAGIPHEGADELDDAVSFFNFLLPDDWTLDAALALAKQWFTAPSAVGPVETAACKATADNNDWNTLFRWVMNVILYVTWTEPGEHVMLNKEAQLLWQRANKAKGEKRKKLFRRYRETDPNKRIVLGRNVVLDRGTSQTPSDGPRGTRGPTRVRTRVSGFWKRVVYGKGRTGRRWQWLEPYWRGGQDSPINTPKHVVK